MTGACIAPNRRACCCRVYDCVPNTMQRLTDESKVTQTTSGMVYGIKHGVFIALETGSYGMGR